MPAHASGELRWAALRAAAAPRAVAAPRAAPTWAASASSPAPGGYFGPPGGTTWWLPPYELGKGLRLMYLRGGHAVPSTSVEKIIQRGLIDKNINCTGIHIITGSHTR